METYNELEIKGSNTDLLTFLESVKKSLSHEWVLDELTAANYAKISSKSTHEIICVKSPEINKQRGLVWFGIWENYLQVFNIVPLEPGSLSYEQYNGILHSFFDQCIKINLDKYRLDVRYDTAGIDVEKVAGKEVFVKLVTWEKLCNRSTGNTHPNDFERWADFVITAHKTNSKINSTLLGRWLVEERGWNDELDITARITLDFEYAISILKEYDKY